MITVACVKWGNKYSSHHVNALEEMVKKYLTVEHEFVCLTERPNGVNCRTIEFTSNEIEGWWAKMNLFADHGFSSWILYLDLDMIIHHNINCFVEDKSKEFFALRDFHYPETFNSSVMFWKRDAQAPMWSVYAEDPERFREMFKGDQDLITKLVKSGENWGEFPDEWTWSWRWGSERNNKPSFEKKFHINDQARIAVFHGRPNPWEIDMHEFYKRVNNAAA